MNDLGLRSLACKVFLEVRSLALRQSQHSKIVAAKYEFGMGLSLCRKLRPTDLQRRHKFL